MKKAKANNEVEYKKLAAFVDKTYDQVKKIVKKESRKKESTLYYFAT